MNINNLKYQLYNISLIAPVPICLYINGTIECDDPWLSELYMDQELIALLCKDSKAHLPFLYTDNENFQYGVVYLSKSDRIFVGPIYVSDYQITQKWDFKAKHNIKSNTMQIHRMPLYRFMRILMLINNLVSGQTITDYDILNNNQQLQFIDTKKTHIYDEEIKYNEYLSHHSYQMEREWIEAERRGDRTAMNHYVEKLIPHVGKLSQNALNQIRYLFVTQVALMTRTLIEESGKPDIAYKVSDELIQMLDKCSQQSEIVALMYKANDVFASLIEETRINTSDEAHIEDCKSYIIKNYRNEITLEDVANEIGLNAAYLSHLFSQKEKTTMKEFLNKVRVEKASNLLKYSNSSIIEIGEYVGFASQSYFGKIFKRYKNMSPGQYRKKNHISDFSKNTSD